MLVLLAIVLFVIGAAIFVGAGVLWFYMAKWEYREPFSVICPENLQPVEIRVDGDVAARTRFEGHEALQVTACSRWPEKSECNQSCAPQVPMLGDDRRLVKYAAFALPPRYLRINNPVRMTPDLYEQLTEQLERQRKTGRVA
jgi:hypothetical protein